MIKYIVLLTILCIIKYIVLLTILCMIKYIVLLTIQIRAPMVTRCFGNKSAIVDTILSSSFFIEK